MNNRTCTFPDCENPLKVKGLCRRHYDRQAAGKPLKPLRPTEPVARFWSFVDKTETCWKWTGGLTTGGYAQFTMSGEKSQCHRLAYQWLVGPIPEGMLLDHKCHVRNCVNPKHLRPVTSKQNAEHRLGAQANNTKSGVRGVYWHAGEGKWRAMVRHNQKLVHLGLFETIPEAEAAVIAKRSELFTHSDRDRVA